MLFHTGKWILMIYVLVRFHTTILEKWQRTFGTASSKYSWENILNEYLFERGKTIPHKNAGNGLNCQFWHSINFCINISFSIWGVKEWISIVGWHKPLHFFITSFNCTNLNAIKLNQDEIFKCSLNVIHFPYQKIYYFHWIEFTSFNIQYEYDS